MVDLDGRRFSARRITLGGPQRDGPGHIASRLRSFADDLQRRNKIGICIGFDHHHALAAVGAEVPRFEFQFRRRHIALREAPQVGLRQHRRQARALKPQRYLVTHVIAVIPPLQFELVFIGRNLQLQAVEIDGVATIDLQSIFDDLVPAWFITTLRCKAV